MCVVVACEQTGKRVVKRSVGLELGLPQSLSVRTCMNERGCNEVVGRLTASQIPLPRGAGRLTVRRCGSGYGRVLQSAEGKPRSHVPNSSTNSFSYSATPNLCSVHEVYRRQVAMLETIQPMKERLNTTFSSKPHSLLIRSCSLYPHQCRVCFMCE